MWTTVPHHDIGVETDGSRRGHPLTVVSASPGRSWQPGAFYRRRVLDKETGQLNLAVPVVGHLTVACHLPAHGTSAISCWKVVDKRSYHRPSVDPASAAIPHPSVAAVGFVRVVALLAWISTHRNSPDIGPRKPPVTSSS